MGLGHRSLSLDWDPDLVEAIRPGQSVIQIYRGEVLDDAWVVLVKDPREDGIALDGVGLDWFLGLDTEGPLISDAEYLACNDKLANGGFELGDLYWRLAEETAWRVATTSTYVGGTPRSGQWFASLALDPVDEDYLPLDDDLIDSDEPVRVLSGQQFAALAYAKRFAGSVGRIRLRALLSGRVVHPNVLPGLLAGWTDTSEFPTDCDIDGVTGLATIGPTSRTGMATSPI
jgi:hypothetical protein